MEYIFSDLEEVTNSQENVSMHKYLLKHEVVLCYCMPWAAIQ